MNELYSFAVTNAYVSTTIRNQCTSTTQLCVGGADSTGTTLQLIACGNCYVITSATALNSPVLNNGIYWYFTLGSSFGFSPFSIITQNSADTTDTNGDLRLSWHIGSGGYRIGMTKSATTQKKMIFLKN